MKYGFIKDAAASHAGGVADWPYHAAQAVAAMRQAEAGGIHMLVLRELGLCG